MNCRLTVEPAQEAGKEAEVGGAAPTVAGHAGCTVLDLNLITCKGTPIDRYCMECRHPAGAAE